MIEPMKKITIVVKTAWENEVLDILRRKGVIHVQQTGSGENEKTELLKEKILLMEDALSLIHGKTLNNKTPFPLSNNEDGYALAGQLLKSSSEIKVLEEEIRRLEAEYKGMQAWGEFNPEDLKNLKDAGFNLRLFQCRQKELKKIDGLIEVYIISSRGSTLFIAVVLSGNDKINIPFQEMEIPPFGLNEINVRMEEKKGRISACRQEISLLSAKVSLIKNTLAKYRNIFDYEETKERMGKDGELSYLVGYCPEHYAESIRETAMEKKWAILIEDPLIDDPVPTLIRYSRWTILFRPVMNFIGVTPGYREYDTNGLFLIFFGIFFAFLIGDGGYGIFIFLITFIAYRFCRFISKELALLFYFLSAMTILWGAVTGTWFGAQSLSRLPLLKQLIIPSLYSYSKESEPNIIRLCFLTGAVQLSIAHVRAAARLYPSLKAIAETGWLFLVWGIYSLATFLVLNEKMSFFGIYLPIIGLLMVLFFGGEGEGGILKRIGRDLTRFPLNVLTAIGSFSDIISYVRLFAVGLATKEVAAAFNSMVYGMGFEDIFSVLTAVFILVFGHTINMLLAAMAVLVHGVRLNLLEFSRHLNMEWSGIVYRPFKIMGERV